MVEESDRPAHWLNIPNLITISRLLMAVVLFVLIEADGWWKTATVLFAIAAATDFLDGFIARRYGLVTPLGRILDPFADKIIICGVFVFLLSVGGSESKSGVTAWIVVVVLAREMFVTSLRGFLEKRGQDFSAALSGKLKMVLQCAAVPLCLLSMDREIVEQFDSLIRARDFLVLVMVVVTVFSGVEYSIRATQMLRRGRSSETPSDDTASS
ncbi:MAG: CDP-diacylglycerol--glycerol-3-phosphate 3-phosphatidyltransferase [Planctomycetota bacterium]|nr:CDP-diacylglycerol--glycerol-3-phosphate 3-phosphatidyltransferase [Planctomycetota bacterium]